MKAGLSSWRARCALLSERPSRARRVLSVCLLFTGVQLAGIPQAGAVGAADTAPPRNAQAITDHQAASAVGPGQESTGPSTDTPEEAELHCLALNIYFEARSEPESGQLAVGHVVMNRVAHPGYPDSVCDVVQQGGEETLHRCQFSWWCDGQSDKPINRRAWDRARRLAQEIYAGNSQDSTDGALWYHATYVKPYWSDLLLKGARIGQHIFYLENREPSETL